MTTHAVALRVTPCLGIECKFWLGDDSWNASSEHPSITVQADTFERAKAEMESALGDISNHFWRQAGQSIKGRRLKWSAPSG
jgi:hypothetical protein